MTNRTLPSRPAVDADTAAGLVAEVLRQGLAEVAPSEVPDFEELMAYAEGRLDEVEREVLESRLADDQDLAAEVAALAAEHRELVARRAASRPARWGATGRRWAALAALLAVALLGSWLFRQAVPADPAPGSATARAVRPQPVGSVPMAETTVSARLGDGSFESGRLAPLHATATQIDFESGSLSGLSVRR